MHKFNGHNIHSPNLNTRELTGGLGMMSHLAQKECVCEKWTDVPKGNRVHQTWSKAPFKTWKKSTEKIREHEQSRTHQDAIVKAEMAKEADRHGSVLEQQSQQLDDSKKQKKLAETGWC